MAQLATSFNSKEHDTEQRDFTPLPDADYRLEVQELALDPTSSGSGSVLKLTIVVLEPEQFAGRKIWANINIENANPIAQEIGQKELASLCRACGVSEISDSEELHFKPFTAKVGLGKPSKEKDASGAPRYPAKTEIKRFYFPDEGAVPEVKSGANDNAAASTARSTQNGGSAASKPAPAKPATAAPPGGKKRPW